MDSGAPKENANPTIRLVDKDRSHTRRTPFEWSQLGSFEKSTSSESSVWTPTSAEDRAILKALVDVSQATHGKGVSLLETVGLAVPDSTQDMLRYPTFRVTPVKEDDEEESKTDTATASEISRDKIDAEEVFDIIRNIQDPEHPNTLEELAVVSLEQVKVVDEGPNLKSTVDVRFT